jgi:hypothetical protein
MLLCGFCWLAVVADLPGAFAPLKLADSISLSGQTYSIHGLTFDGSSLLTLGSGMSTGWEAIAVSPQTGQVVSTTPLPALESMQIPRALAYDGTTYYAAVDNTVQSFQAGDSVSTQVYSAADGSATGLALEGSSLWVATDNSGWNLDRLNLSESLFTGLCAIAPTVQGLTWDAQHLWTSRTATGSAGTLITEYDKSGKSVVTYSLPKSISNGISSLAFDGQYLWAIDAASPTLYKFSLPPVRKPARPAGVLSLLYIAGAGGDIDGQSYVDSQSGPGYSVQLPVAASVAHYQDAGGSVQSWARAYTDSTGQPKHSFSAKTVGLGSEIPSDSIGQLEMVQQSVITSSRAGRSTGSKVSASGKVTLTGGWRLERADADTDIGATEALFQLTISLVYSGSTQNARKNASSGGSTEGPISIFDGTIVLQRPEGGTDWASVSLLGDMDQAGLARYVRNHFTLKATEATLNLSSYSLPYQLPVTVGEAFSIDVVMRAYTSVDAGVTGGAEVSFGQTLSVQSTDLSSPALGSGSSVGSDPPRMPEPASLGVMLLSGLAVLWRKGKSRRHG